jgi:cholesterol transport system auxiliary component
MKPRLFIDVAAVGTLVLLGACTGSLLESKQPIMATYVLAPPPAAAGTEPLGADLAVSVPRVSPGLEGHRIAVLKGRLLDYYADARWGAEVPRVVQSLIVRTVAGQNSFRSAAAEDVRIDSAYVLDLEVTQFQAEYDGATPRAHVAFIGHLIRVRDRTLVETLSADATAPADDNRMTAVIEAFEKAAQRASVDLASKVATAARGDSVKRQKD